MGDALLLCNHANNNMDSQSLTGLSHTFTKSAITVQRPKMYFETDGALPPIIIVVCINSMMNAGSRQLYVHYSYIATSFIAKLVEI